MKATQFLAADPSCSGNMDPYCSIKILILNTYRAPGLVLSNRVEMKRSQSLPSIQTDVEQ